LFLVVVGQFAAREVEGSPPGPSWNVGLETLR
jgi:hypothetical protein